MRLMLYLATSDEQPLRSGLLGFFGCVDSGTDRARIRQQCLWIHMT